MLKKNIKMREFEIVTIIKNVNSVNIYSKTFVSPVLTLITYLPEYDL
jgi:hypothetical protein